MTFHALPYPFTIGMEQSALYNTIEYLQNYPVDDVYRLVVTENNVVMGQVNLYLKNEEAINAPYSGFGGIEHCLPAVMLGEFVNKIIAWCEGRGLRHLRLKLPSSIYSDNAELTESVLREKGFDTVADEANQYIVVSGSEYASFIRNNERKRLRKCRDAGFKFKKLQVKALEAAYEIIKDNRIRKGFPITMAFGDLEKMYLRFPEKYLLFGVLDGDKLIAVSVSIRVTTGILYNFYHGDVAAYRQFSPIVMAIEGIYNYCQQHAFGFLDLGISSVGGNINNGLFKFKENCGGIITSKRIVRKVLQ